MGLCSRVFAHFSGAMCSLTVNFASTRIKCFLAFAQKYLPQYIMKEDRVRELN